MANVGVSAIKLIDSDGDALDDGSGKLNVNATLVAGATIDIGDVDLYLEGGTALVGGNGTATSGTLRVTIASDTTGVLSVDDNGSTLSIDDGGGAITVDGTVTAELSSTDNTVLDNILTKNTEIDAVLDTIKVDTEAIETAVELLDNAISGTEMQVDVVASLPAGSNAIGKLAANSGVDIGDVDVTSTVQPTGHGTVVHGSNTDVDTVAERMDAGAVACKHIDIMAATTNAGIIYVGATGVSATTGIALYPGDVYSIDFDSGGDIYVIASEVNQAVQWVSYN